MDSGGRLIVFSVSPKKTNNLSLCLDFIDLVYLRWEGLKGLSYTGRDYSHYLNKTITDLPYPVCYYEISKKNTEGVRITTTRGNGEDLICWTNYWHIPPERVPIEVKKALESKCPEKWDTYKDLKTNNELFDIVSCQKHLRAENARECFEKYSNNLFVLGTWEGWPIAFAVRIGRNAIVVVPDFIDVKAFISELEDLPARGIEKVKAYLAKHPKTTGGLKSEGTAKHHIEVMSLDPVSKIDGKIDKKLSVKVDGRPVSVPPKRFLQFLVIWYASNVGGRLIHATRSQEEEMKTPLKRIMMLNKDGRPEVLPGAGILYPEGAADNLKQEFKEIVSFNIYGSQKPGKVDNREIVNDIIQDRMSDGEKYFTHKDKDIKFSCLKLNVEISMSEDVRGGLEKIPIELPNKNGIDASFFKALYEKMSCYSDFGSLPIRQYTLKDFMP